jgi:hypothetical protein
MKVRLQDRRWDWSFVLRALAMAGLLFTAQDRLPAAHPVSFTRDIAPILQAKCETCHGAEKPKGKYQLHTFEALLKPGSSDEPPIVAGEPAKSLLHSLLLESDPDNRMPQKDDPLPQAQIELIARWIKEGAKFDGLDPKATLASLVPRAPHPEPPARYPFPVPITALAFHPISGELAVSGYHEVTLWDAEKGELKRRLQNLPRQIQSLAFHPEGSLLAVAGGTAGRSGEVVLVDAQTGRATRTLLTLSDMVLAVTFSPDGSRLAAAGSDNAIHLFDPRTGQRTLTIAQHADWVMDIAFSPDGQHLASASRDRTARVYHTENGGLEATYTGHDSFVNAVVFSPDGKSIFSAGRDKKVGVWKATEGDQTATIGGFDGEVFRLLASEGRLVSACADRRVRLHDLGDRSLKHTLEGHQDWVYTLAVHPAGKRLASGSYDGEVRVWDLASGSQMSVFTAAPGLVAAK